MKRSIKYPELHKRLLTTFVQYFYGRYGLIIVLAASKFTLITATIFISTLQRSSNFCNWDCFWYLSIVNEGYQTAPNTEAPIGAANWAFFPLVPTLVRTINLIAPLNLVFLAAIINTIAFLAALQIVEKISKQDSHEARKTSLLIALSPISIYINTFYTESIYFFLVCAVAYLVKRNLYVYASVAAGFLSATRVTGVFLSTAVVIFLIVAWFQRKIHLTKLLVGVVFSYSGIIIFSTYLKFLTDDFLAFIHIQKAWGVGQKSFFEWVIAALKFESPTQLIYLAVFTVTSLLTLYLLRQRQFFEALITAIPVITTIVTSAVNLRYFLVSYVPYLVLASFSKKSKKLRAATFLIMFLSTLFGQIAWQLRLGFMI